MSSSALIDWSQFKGDDAYFIGNHRAIVEDNDDPQKAGRVRVRIYGLHSPFSEETPTPHLPWAQPCLSIGWSGGHNIYNKESVDITTRYRPGNQSDQTLPAKNSTFLQPPSVSNVSSFVDPVEDDCGTGGIFTVPRKGTIVWVFFEGGDHTSIHYFCASPKKKDWQDQQVKITGDVKDKIDQVASLRDNFTPDRELYSGSAPANNAGVQTWCSKPRMSIYPIDNIPQQNITSFTSATGTTFIIVNDAGHERIYVVNKGYISQVDEYGHKKELVGPTSTGNSNNTINSNDEKLVAGHSELHIMGDYNVFTDGNCFFQVQGNAQFNVSQNVGIVSQSGDVDVVVKSGNCNLELTQGNMNAHVAGNLQAQIDNSMIAKVGSNVDLSVSGNLTAEVEGSTSIQSDGGIVLSSSGGDITLDAGAGNLNLLCTSFMLSANSDVNITAPAGVDIDAGSSFAIDATGFGGDVSMNAPISNALHTGCYPGPGAGPPTPFIAVPNPAVPATPVQSTQFSDSPKSETVQANVSDNEQTDDVDAPDNPQDTVDPSSLHG
jgi:hypothetical protein